MTRFAGVFDPAGDAAPLSDFPFEADRPGGGGTRRWRDGWVSLLQADTPSRAEAAGDDPPVRSAAGHVIAGDIRLDNRDDLFDALGMPEARRAGMGDAELVLAAYARWGRDCAARLLGDFAFALWDPRTHRLLCATDHFAMRQFYYRAEGRRFIFASRPELVLALAGVSPEPDLTLLAMAVDLRAAALFPGATFFEGVRVLPGGTLIEIGPQGPVEHRYWTPGVGTPLRFADDGAFREAFQHHFFNAVKKRLRSSSPVTAMLSGGLDSSSIVAAAAMLLKKENRVLDVLAVVLPDGHDPGLSDEREYVDQFRSFDNVRINYVFAEGKGPFSGLDALISSFGPAVTSRHYNYAAMAERCGELGSAVILDGAMGEAGPTYPGNGYLAELFRTLQWRSLWREMRAARSQTGVSLRRQIKSRVVKPLLPSWLLRKAMGATDVNIAGLGIFSPDFAREMHRRVEACPSSDRVFRGATSLCRGQLQLLEMYRTRGVVQPPAGGAIEHRFPLMDVPLLQFCLDAPASFKVRNGYSRSLVRIGLEGILPPSIQWRVTKTPFSPDYLPRYNSQIGRVRAFLKDIPSHDPVRKIVDVDRVLALARLPVANDESDPAKIQAAMHRVPTAIYTIAFLRQFSSYRT